LTAQGRETVGWIAEMAGFMTKYLPKIGAFFVARQEFATLQSSGAAI
jgi:hypothetical protein